LEPLIQYDRDVNPVPGLAESWEVLDDNVTWEFVLRQGVTFQNGAPFNADAVKFTVDRIMNEELRGQGLSDPFPTRSGVQSVSVVDEFTAQMVLAEANIVLPVFVTFVYILEPGYYTDTSTQETALNPVGTGPYRVTEWVTGDHLTLERYEDYWRGTPPIPTIIMKPIPERATRLNLLLTGEADIVGDLTPDDFPTVEGSDNLRISQSPGSRRMHIGVPANVPRYADRRVRKALQMAIDFEGITEALLGPMAPEERRATVLVSSTDWTNPDIPLIPYDPDMAKSELDAAGFPFDEAVRVISPQGRYLKDTEVAQAVAGNLRDVGIDAEVEILEWTVYVDRMGGDQGLGDIYLLGLGSRFYGPEDLSIVTTDQVFDQTGWIDSTENGPKFKEMYAQLTQTADVDEQHQMVEEMLMLFHEEYVWMPLWIQPAATAVNERLTFEDSGGGNRFSFWLPEEDPVLVTG
ncbi:MAG: ABC transporter substrate-binding protein, partial [Chloroflexota bacterium]|nr:ABC transporter substrate-binding protein [Chloroflexota bacterium]